MSLVRSLKEHLSFLIPLIALLFSLQTYLVVQKVVASYEAKLNSGYAIVIATDGELKIEELNSTIKNIKNLTEISAESMLNRIKEDISSANYALLKLSLPKFYKITLDSFPDEKELKKIEDQLRKNQKIKKIETFSKTHSELYMLLSLTKMIVKIFAIVVFFISFMLMIKQIEVWRLTHSERMSIMELFGSPYWMKSAALFKFAILDSLFATLIVSGFFFYLSQKNPSLLAIWIIDSEAIRFDPINDGLNLLLASMILSFVSVLIVISSKAKEW